MLTYKLNDVAYKKCIGDVNVQVFVASIIKSRGKTLKPMNTEKSLVFDVGVKDKYIKTNTKKKKEEGEKNPIGHLIFPT